MKKLLVGAIAAATVFFGIVYTSGKSAPKVVPPLPEDYELGV